MPNEKILDEHFWFTATVLAVNGFLISAKFLIVPRVGVQVFSTFISLYGVMLILDRAAAHAGRLPVSAVPDDKMTLMENWADTVTRLRCLRKELGFVIVDMSGALFYLLLIIGSATGVWCSQPS